jgi:flagellar motor switch protein FliN
MSDQIHTQEEIDALLRGEMDMGNLNDDGTGGDNSNGGEPPSNGGSGGGTGSNIFDDILSDAEKNNLLEFTQNYIAVNLNVIESILGINSKILSQELKFVDIESFLQEKTYWGSVIEFIDGIWGKFFFLFDKEIAVGVSKLLLQKEEVSEEKLLESEFFEISNHIFGVSLPQLQNYFQVLVQGVLQETFTTETPDNKLVQESSHYYAAIFNINIENIGSGVFVVLYPWLFVNDNKSYFEVGMDSAESGILQEDINLSEQIDEQELEKVIGELAAKQNVDLPSEEEMPSSQSQTSGEQLISPEELASLQNMSIPSETPPQQPVSPAGMPQTTPPPSNQAAQYQANNMSGMQGGMEIPAQQVQQPFSQPASNKFANATIQNVEFSEINPGNVQNKAMPRNIELLLDVPLKVTVELGRTRKKIRDILELGVGSVIELEKQAGESVDLLVNDNLIAKGEVVVIDENFGIRITSIVSPQERLERIK